MHQDPADHGDLERCWDDVKDDRAKYEGNSSEKVQTRQTLKDQSLPQRHSIRSKGETGKTYFVPLSIALVRPPVCRDRWNLRSIESRCSNVSRATLRIAFWATEAKSALRSSEKSVEKIRAAPSESAKGRTEGS